ncbi:hypothetical protein NDU88_000529 [Pleurodeles waltl]|uniref:Uncharacterized protein n=1 Tax=Pleurodeles waltl TaxID=8319 RepID=A0AAV7S7R7_PLEWA|nr:hypothetical protein NDU88_000529 [Pleurodeles waltl]
MATTKQTRLRGQGLHLPVLRASARRTRHTALFHASERSAIPARLRWPPQNKRGSEARDFTSRRSELRLDARVMPDHATPLPLAERAIRPVAMATIIQTRLEAQGIHLPAL